MFIENKKPSSQKKGRELISRVATLIVNRDFPRLPLMRITALCRQSLIHSGFRSALQDGFTKACYWFAPTTSSLRTKTFATSSCHRFIRTGSFCYILTNNPKNIN